MTRRWWPGISAVVLLVCFPAGVFAQDAMHFRFVGTIGQQPAGGALVSEGAIRLQGQLQAPADAIRVSGDVPQPFVYNPLSGRSQPAGVSLELRAAGNQPRHIAVPVPAATHKGGSITIEAIVRNGEAMPAPGGASLPILTFRSADGVQSLGLVIRPAHNYNWWAGSLTQAGRSRHLGREMYQGWTHVRGPVWRHMAVVYDADRKTVTTYLDYTPLDALSVDQPLNIGDGTLHIGDLPDNSSARRFVGNIAEVRLTAAALHPWQLLRATPHNLSDVSFAPRPGPLPEGSGYVDLRLRYGAVGDGRHDDTHAFRRAFAELQDRVPIAFHTLYIPEGSYLISEPISWTRFLIVQGAGSGKTTLRLKDHCPGFTDADRPDAVLYAGWGNWRESTGKGAAGNVIGNYIFGLTIDTGAGNPGAVALSFHSNNHGAMEDIAVRSGDGQGRRGVDFSTNWPGPTLIKHLTVDGFDTGIFARAGEYSLVFEHITLRNQRKEAIENQGNILSIRKLTSVNSVPVVRTGGWGMVTLIDSELRSPTPADMAAIQNNEQGALYVRNVRVDGYAAAIHSDDRQIPGGLVKEFLAGRPQSLFDAPATTLNMPIEETPEIPLADGGIKWVNVLDFARESQPGDWAPVIQAAFDSGVEAVFFPSGRGDGYRVRQTVKVPPTVRYILGMRNGIGRHDSFKEGPTVVVEQGAEHPLIMERFVIGGTLRHAGPRTVVFRHNGPNIYEGVEGAGKVLAENTETFWRLARGQQAWGRQLNPESHKQSEVINDGGNLWILGLKTEYATTMVVNRNGGRLEVLGGFLYPVTPVPPEMPMVVNENATMSMIFGTSAYTNDHRVYFRDTQGDQTREMQNRQVDSKGARRQVHLYTSQPAR